MLLFNAFLVKRMMALSRTSITFVHLFRNKLNIHQKNQLDELSLISDEINKKF
jgi:hypothetical protein